MNPGRSRVRSIEDVVATQLCCGCGACAYVRPDAIRMVDDKDLGRRPVVTQSAADPSSDQALATCPGVGLEHRFDAATPGLIQELAPAWGPILEVFEGFASDPAIRHAGSSGGALTALASWCVEHGGFAGVLHVAAREDVPYLNRTVLSKTRKELMAATGSRYAPASPCDGLQRIEDADGPCAFIGKPCDVAAVDAVRRIRPRLDARIGVTLAFFCAGTPSTEGTLEMIRAMGIADPESVVSVRYRGNGWPGNATVRFRTETGEEERQLTYQQSWGEILQRYRQWRCYVCADHTGEFADIAVGDPWYRPTAPDEPGRSLILVRTERGRGILAAAVAAGYLTVERADPSILPRSQINLLRGRGALWGRVWALRLLGAAAPCFLRMPMFRFWLSQLSLKEKLQSFYGTFKRVFTRRLLKRAEVRPFVPRGAAAANDRSARR